MFIIPCRICLTLWLLKKMNLRKGYSKALSPVLRSSIFCVTNFRWTHLRYFLLKALCVIYYDTDIYGVFFCVVKEEEGCTLLQREKNSRTRLDVMKEHKKKRMDELKSFIARDHELCRIICTTPFSIDQDSVPSLQQLKTYQAYLDNLTKEKVPLFVSVTIGSKFYQVLTISLLFPGVPPSWVCEHQKRHHNMHGWSGAGARDQLWDGCDVWGWGGVLSVRWQHRCA